MPVTVILLSSLRTPQTSRVPSATAVRTRWSVVAPYTLTFRPSTERAISGIFTRCLFISCCVRAEISLQGYCGWSYYLAEHSGGFDSVSVITTERSSKPTQITCCKLFVQAELSFVLCLQILCTACFLRPLGLTISELALFIGQSLRNRRRKRLVSVLLEFPPFHMFNMFCVICLDL